MATNNSGPRIYNLFPLLAGPVAQWEERLAAIAGMHFNWIFVNPFHLPGASGSLYAVKDYYELNPAFQGASREPPDQLLRHFIDRAREHGLAIMMDLVINHTARDSGLVDAHPGWYVHNEDGSVKSPHARDPNDPGKVTVWEDLADIDYEHIKHRDELLNYWKEVVHHYGRMGFAGFRCDAAYKVPGDIWGEIINAARSDHPEAQFFAETLGARPEQIKQLRSAGFDYFFNSAKWWDFHQDWLLKQYERYRHIAPSIAFPESHDTARLAADKRGDERQSRLWYLFAACFSAGVMMPVGYEFGFRKKLHVVKTRPSDWEQPSFDITAFIRAVNEMKARTPVLNEEGPQKRFTAPGDALVGLLRRSDHSKERAVVLMNTDAGAPREFSVAELAKALAVPRASVQEISPSPQEPFAERDTVAIPPLEIRVFHRDDHPAS